jgi:hypothetical protein
VPVKLTVWGLFVVVSVIVNEPVRIPVVVGVKFT